MLLKIWYNLGSVASDMFMQEIHLCGFITSPSSCALLLVLYWCCRIKKMLLMHWLLFLLGLRIIKLESFPIDNIIHWVLIEVMLKIACNLWYFLLKGDFWKPSSLSSFGEKYWRRKEQSSICFFRSHCNQCKGQTKRLQECSSFLYWKCPSTLWTFIQIQPQQKLESEVSKNLIPS